MSKIRDIQIFPLKDEISFEELCLDIWKRKLNDPHTQLNGRRGQRQHGVDIFGRRRSSLEWVGIQCKVKTKGNLTKDEIDKEIKKAILFNPKLSEYIIVTTGPRDQTLQEHARLCTESNLSKGLFNVSIAFWNDVEIELADERNIDICYRYYREFFIDSTNHGIAIGKLLTIEIGTGKTADSQYELMIGKVPKGEDPDNYYGINYYKGTYFIINYHERKFETFPIPCYLSDLEQAFRSKRDAHIISVWINDQENLDDLIYGKSEHYKKILTTDEYEEFYKMMNQNE